MSKTFKMIAIASIFVLGGISYATAGGCGSCGAHKKAAKKESASTEKKKACKVVDGACETKDCSADACKDKEKTKAKGTDKAS